MREIVRQQGLGGCYKGLTPTVLRQGSNQAIRFFIVETLKDWYRRDDPKKPINKLVIAAFGAFSGLVSVSTAQ